MKRLTYLTLCAAIPAVLAFSLTTSRADIQPARLVAGSIYWDGKFAIGQIYVGGTYGQTVPGGRIATLEFFETGKGWYTLTSQRLPDIGTKGFYLAAPLGQRKTSTTIRLRITPASVSPPSDVSQKTFPGTINGFSLDAPAIPRTKKATDIGPFKK